jgi:hypothetical protein
VVTEFKVRKARRDLTARRSLQILISMGITEQPEATMVTGRVEVVAVPGLQVIVVAVQLARITLEEQVVQV